MTTAMYPPTPPIYGTGPQLTPYGFWGDLAGAIAPTAGRIVGGVFGNEQLGGQIGATAGQLAQRFLPFQAGPTVDPTQGYGQINPLVAQQVIQQQLIQQQIAQQQAIQQQIAQQQIAQQVMQQQATQAQQVTPYGFWGDLAGAIAPTAGRIVGGVFGNEQLGGQIGATAGQLAQRFLPFQAGPTVDPTQGYGQINPLVAQQVIQQQLIQQQIAQQQAIAQQIAQQAIQQQQAQQTTQQPVGPAQQLAPYGFWGDLAGAIAPTAGRIVGGVFGNEQLGGQIGATAGQLAQRFLPFQAGPVPYTGQFTPMTAHLPQTTVGQPATVPQLAPYGIFGGALGSVLGGLGGSALGGFFGNSDLGRTIGGTAGGILGGILPFNAGVPAFPGVGIPQYAGAMR